MPDTLLGTWGTSGKKTNTSALLELMFYWCVHGEERQPIVKYEKVLYVVYEKLIKLWGSIGQGEVVWVCWV